MHVLALGQQGLIFITIMGLIFITIISTYKIGIKYNRYIPFFMTGTYMSIFIIRANMIRNNYNTNMIRNNYNTYNYNYIVIIFIQ